MSELRTMVANTKSVFVNTKNYGGLRVSVPKSHQNDLTSLIKHRPIATVTNAINGKSKAFIADRGQHPRNSSVFILPEPRDSVVGTYKHAEDSATDEEKKMTLQKLEKETKLKQFQEDVKRRVKAIEQQKQLRQLEKSYQAVEIERRVISQSSFVDNSISKRDTCIIRDNPKLAMKSNVEAFFSQQPVKIIEHRRPHSGNIALLKHSEKVQQLSSKAREILTSRKIVPTTNESLPGGRWREGPTQDLVHPTRSEVETQEITNPEEAVACIAENSQFKGNRNVYFSEDVQYHEDSTTCENRKTMEADEIAVNKDQRTDPCLPDKLCIESFKHRKTVSECKNSTEVKYQLYDSEEDRKRQIRNQYTMYRRLFMDIEREQVRENIKRRQHRQKVVKIKERNETVRRIEENRIRELMESKNPPTGENTKQMRKRQQEEENEALRQLRLRRKKLQRDKEIERYIDALRQTLKDRLKFHNVELPTMCSCGTSVWDTNPDTCANNCIFYRNPKAYARALSSLLLSCDVP